MARGRNKATPRTVAFRPLATDTDIVDWLKQHEARGKGAVSEAIRQAIRLQIQVEQQGGLPQPSRADEDALKSTLVRWLPELADLLAEKLAVRLPMAGLGQSTGSVASQVDEEAELWKSNFADARLYDDDDDD